MWEPDPTIIAAPPDSYAVMPSYAHHAISVEKVLALLTPEKGCVPAVLTNNEGWYYATFIGEKDAVVQWIAHRIQCERGSPGGPWLTNFDGDSVDELLGMGFITSADADEAFEWWDKQPDE